MNCPNCGAAMDLVESRRYFRCPHCGTYHFPQAVEAEGIRVVGHQPDGPDCPVCRVRMAHAFVDEQEVDFCANCRGLLMPRPTFAHVTNSRRAWATSPPGEPVPLNRRELSRALDCPRCHNRFETYAHYGPGNVVIDNCTTCDLVWLDFGEMRSIVEAPGRDRGSKHVARIDDAYVRRGPFSGESDGERQQARRRSPGDPLAFLIEAMFDR